MANINLERTLEQLENDYWGEPTYPSHLVTTFHKLRKKPLKDFTNEDFRILIGQDISLDILVPLAFQRLKQNIMASGDLYPGDLLQNVLGADKAFWLKNPLLHRQLNKLYRKNLPAMEKLVGKSIIKSIFKKISENYESFNSINFKQE